MSAKPNAVMLRISDEDQSYDSQKLVVDRWLASNGIDPKSVAWYQDIGTGRNLDRSGFEQLEADIKTRKRRTVIVYALDRISRDFFDGVAVLGRWLKAGVRVVSITEPIDLSGELGQALAGVIFALAAAEWRKRKERQTAGIEVAKARGAYQGRKPGTLKGSPARARELRESGLTGPEIARSMGIGLKTVFRYLAQTSS